MTNNEHTAMCGLDCSKCEAFIATLKNNDTLRQKVAEKWTERYQRKGYNRTSVTAEDINCRGCLSDGPIYLYCGQCKIRQCGLERGLGNCKECSDYRCDELVEKQKHFW